MQEWQFDELATGCGFDELPHAGTKAAKEGEAAGGDEPVGEEMESAWRKSFQASGTLGATRSNEGALCLW